MQAQGNVTDRFHRALYGIMFTPGMVTTTKHTMFFNVLYKTIKNDTNKGMWSIEEGKEKKRRKKKKRDQGGHEERW